MNILLSTLIHAYVILSMMMMIDDVHNHKSWHLDLPHTCIILIIKIIYIHIYDIGTYSVGHYPNTALKTQKKKNFFLSRGVA